MEWGTTHMNLMVSPDQKRTRLLHWALICIPVVVLLGLLSGVVGQDGPDSAWFEALEKPKAFPPPATFGIVWSILYAVMGFALALIISAYGARGRSPALGLFFVQFALNLAWSPVFFGLHRMTDALIILVVMLIVAVLTAMQFLRVRWVAGVLMMPYIVWLVFACYLNFAFLQANPHLDGVVYSGAVERFDI